MVGTRPAVRRAPYGPLLRWVFTQVTTQSHRFLRMDDRGWLTVGMDRLALLVTEIVTEHTADLQAQLDAAEGLIEQLECDLQHAKGGARDMRVTDAEGRR